MITGFGRNREGDFNALKEMGKMFGFEVIALEAEYVNDIRVSSTKIRQAIDQGDMQIASEFLTENFLLVGRVVKGHKLGRDLGFPTANIEVDKELKIIPKNGAYAVWATTPDGTKRKAMLNIGERPTVSDSNNISIEVNILDFSEDLYGENLEIRFVKRLRGERQFANVDELKAALIDDENAVRKILT